MRLALAAAIAVGFLPLAAQAADICKAVALRDVGALEDVRSVIAKGDFDTPITQLEAVKD